MKILDLVLFHSRIPQNEADTFALFGDHSLLLILNMVNDNNTLFPSLNVWGKHMPTCISIASGHSRREALL